MVMETSLLLSAVRKFITASIPLGATELNEEKLSSGLSPPPSGSPEDLPLEGAVWQKEVPILLQFPGNLPFLIRDFQCRPN